jgi:hypothetical protein
LNISAQGHKNKEKNMAYATYSEVYYANTSPNELYGNKILVKIGETTNICRRNKQLASVSMATWYSLERTVCGYNYSARLFVESYLRVKVGKLPGVEPCSTDYFLLPDKATDTLILQNFALWVQEAIALWEQM